MKINILGVKIDSLTLEQVLNKVEICLNSNGQQQIVTANPEIILEAWQNSDYQNLINNSSLVTADGVGLLWAAKFLSLKSSGHLYSLIQMLVSGMSLVFYPEYCKEVLPERITGVDLMQKICEQASKNNWKIYLLGGEKKVAEKTAKALKAKYLNLKIVGAETGPTIQDTGDEAQETNNQQQIIGQINLTNPDILFVAFGAPKQDFWLKHNLAKMPSVKLAMGVGGAFDFISGKVKRAPEIYRDLGLEWLFRLFCEPRRAIRIFNATARFIFNIVRFKHKISNLK